MSRYSTRGSYAARQKKPTKTLVASARPNRERVNPTDVLVGQQVKRLRMERGMSQDTLGKGLGLTFQQVQKYEKGTNRISASRLQQIAVIFGVPVTAMFETVPQNGEQQTEHQVIFSMMDTKGAHRLMRAFNSITGVAARKLVVDLSELLAEQDSQDAVNIRPSDTIAGIYRNNT